MSVTAGALSKVLVGQSTANLSSAAATAGTGPYTYQWYRSTTTGFVAGAGNLISGATALTLNDSGLIPNTSYYYLVIATDTGAGNATSTSSPLTVATEPSLLQNQFAQQSIVGIVDMSVGPTNVIAVQVDVSVTTQIYPGQAVKIVANTVGGIPKVAPIALKSDSVFGFARFNIKDLVYLAGQNLEVAMWGTVIWCYATGAITQFAEVCVDPTYIGGVQATGNTATYIGWAFDGIAAAGLIRVMLMPNIAYTTA
jgi:hypothetical protein